MKEVLLLGDSIRMFSQSEIIRKLGEGYHVSAPGENCRFSAYTLNSLRYWLDEFPKPDIIHWNNGLWDTAVIYQEDGCFTPLEVYVAYMTKILRVLKSTGAKVIFATTTPVDPKKGGNTEPLAPCHRNADIARYNRAMVALMEQEGVPVDDLWSVVVDHIPEYIRQDDLIHPTAAGIDAISDAVARTIKAV